MATTFGTTTAPAPAQAVAIDPKVKALASAILQKESNGNYEAKGASGEYGAYQFMPTTWSSWAAKHLGDAKAPMTVENQNKVAYNQIKEWKDSGLNPAQIASKWNSGKENAYKENYRGVNKFGVAYDVPKYVADISSIYKQKVAGAKEPTPTVQPTPTPVAPLSARQTADVASAEQYKPWAPANTEKQSAFGEAAKVVANVVPSAWNFVKGIVTGIKETPKVIANLPGEIKGLIEDTKSRELLTPEARAKAKTLLGQDVPIVPSASEQVASAAPKATYETLVPEAARGYATAAGGAITGNEGKIDEGLQIAQRAIVNDPVGQILPFIIAAKGVAGKAGYGAEFDSAISKTAGVVTKPVSTVFGKVTAPIKNAAEFTGRQLTGLNKETVQAFAEDPTLKTVTPEGLIGKKETLGSQVQSALAKQKAELGISNETLGKEVQKAFTKRTESLKQTGEAYAPVREFNQPVTVSPTWIDNTISELTGLKIRKGQLQTASNAVLRDASDVRAFQHLYDLYKPAFKKGTISTTEFLNFREDMANLSKFDRQIGKSRPVEDIAKIMRGKFNTEYRPQLKGLENLDKEFGKQTVEMRTLAKGLLDKSGNLTDAGLSKIVKLSETKPTLMAQLEQVSPGITARIKSLQAINELGKGLIDSKGDITDAGMRKIVNAGNEANPQMLAKLEEIKPGITKGIQQYKALQDAQAAIEKHKVGTYARNIGVAGLGGGLLTMNPALIAGAIVEMILTSPENAITIIQTYAKTKPIVTNLANKIKSGQQKVLNTINETPAFLINENNKPKTNFGK